jgi:hypothetical protein
VRQLLERDSSNFSFNNYITWLDVFVDINLAECSAVWKLYQRFTLYLSQLRLEV